MRNVKPKTRSESWFVGLRKSLRTNRRADIDVSDWGMTIVLLIVLFILVGALMPTMITTLTDYAGNETVLGPVLQTLVPILVSVAMLLIAVVVLLAKAREGG